MDNKVVVITGASAGIGAALAELAGKKGWKVVLAARREPELRQVAARVGSEALPVVTDVSRRADVQRLLETALARFGHVDVWVNNAGRGISKLVSELTDEDFDEMMRVNVKSALYGMQTVLPHFQSRGRGHLINVSSMLGRVPYVPERSAYNAAKHALNALTANLRQELRERYPGIHVTTFLPGVVATEFGVNALGGGVDSRKIPGAQSVEEVAAVLVETIEQPRPEVYSRPAYRQQVIEYYSSEDLAIPEPGAPGNKRP
ncbi:SDR family oxidoreductase [Archangium lansingense]|uniref:SDR family oxidoreductase n=1 Tax=Archangium lansingense TaxID=2995310 RepID=UPI003B7D9EBA